MIGKSFKLKDESRKLEARRILHRFFELGILIKGVDGGLELVGGLLFVFLSPGAINRVAFFFVEGELNLRIRTRHIGGPVQTLSTFSDAASDL